ncbi:tRNA (guanine-N(7)-)-methyltransferase [Forsythia ovata]|uniref:tRNA (guanine(46)-N(7))-methyltransferase n=1 Tax=Forsythia ovata TaxID=205694 RepID=A0ABD1S0A9_9LAMI
MMEHEANANSAHSKTTGLRLKRFYRARAHSNPLRVCLGVFFSPVLTGFGCPVDYSVHYPQLFPSPDKFDGSKRIEFADVGCGFGGLLISLSTMFPETLMIGMELRDKVTEYVKERVVALRSSNPGQYENVSVVHVEELGVWMKSCLEGHPLFEAVTKEELEADAVVKLLSSATGEGQKVARNGGANVPSSL